MLSFYEATTDSVFPPFNFVEFSPQFSCGAYLKHPHDVDCVEVDAHGGVLKVEVAGLVLLLHSTTGYQIGDRKFTGPYLYLGLPGFLERTEDLRIE
jgi:hypothetical protein